MKKIHLKIYSIFLVVALLGLFTSCEKEKDTEGVSKITYYANFEMEGESEYLIPTGGAFTDPGIKAYENGVEITVNTTITGDYFAADAIDLTAPNKYVISYSATNQDGFDGSDERVVYVVSTGDLVTSIEGLYTSTVLRSPTQGSGNQTDMTYIMIRKVGANEYEITDGIGGYYDLGRGYGPTYRAGTTIIANNIPTNNFDVSAEFTVGAFGGVATMSGFTVDPVARTINFVTAWDSGYEFNVTLTQVPI